MSAWLYRRILKKIGLDKEQLRELLSRLTSERICAGPFLEDGKMCPNTTALSLKLRKIPETDSEVKSLLGRFGVKRFELAIFYLFFDLPAMFSSETLEGRLVRLRQAVQEML